MNTEEERAESSNEERAADTGKGELGEEQHSAQQEPEVGRYERFKAKVSSAARSAWKFAKSLRFDPLCITRWLERLVSWSKKNFPPEMFSKMASHCVKYGHAAIVAGAALSLLCFLIAAFRTGSFWLFLAGIGYAIALLVLQFTAEKFINAGDTLLKSSPSRLASSSFLDCAALIVEVTGIILFIVLASRGWISAVVGLGAWALCDVVAWVAIHPVMANIQIDPEASAGEEAIGIISFAVKTVVRVVPLAFGVGSVTGAAALLLATLKMLFTGGALTGATHALGLMLLAVCLPFASYLLFAFYHLTIDVLRAILVLPAKLDRTERQE